MRRKGSGVAKTIKPYIFPSIKRDGQHRHANYIFVPFCFLCACVCAIICSRNDDKGEWNVRATITGQKMGKQETTKRVMSFRSTGINKREKKHWMCGSNFQRPPYYLLRAVLVVHPYYRSLTRNTRRHTWKLLFLPVNIPRPGGRRV